MSNRTMARGAGARVLVTGFGPFPGVPENASGVIAARLAARLRRERADADVACQILPTEWRAAPPALETCLDAWRPHVVLHLGISSRAKGLVVETLARNRTRKMEDAAGREPPCEHVAAGGAASLRTGLAVGSLLNRLAGQGLPAVRSNDAGRYICNMIYYHSLAAARRSFAQPQVVLVHLPTIVGSAGVLDPDKKVSEMPEELAMPALLQVIEFCLSARPAGWRASERRECRATWISTGA